MSFESHRVTRLSYCQFLLSSQINYTLTYYADHTQSLSHDAINRYLSRSKIVPSMVWEKVKDRIVFSPNGYILFDDTVLDKSYSHKIELVRRQYSGNAHAVIKGIGLVNCVYYNPEVEQFWIIDYRIFDPDSDGKTKLDHVSEMLNNAVCKKNISFRAVLMDTWYAAKEFMLEVEKLEKIYYCPLRENRLVDDSKGLEPYKHVKDLSWSKKEEVCGKTIKIKGFPKDHKVKLFRVPAANGKTEYIVTNDKSQNSMENTQKECGVRWKIEQFHREIKQVTGIEACQCRKKRIQRNHIGCCMMVWIRFKELAYQAKRTVYEIKQALLDDYLIQQLQRLTIFMT